MFSPWERTALIAASESIPAVAWFVFKAKSTRSSKGSKYPSNWLNKFDFADMLFIASLALLFYFGVQHFPFGTRDELSLCALIGGFAAFLRMTEGPS